ncbi:MAG: putative pterin-4-alpha-carbinolamine dehydratase [Alphaproteobacteria bacterium MarineAlpha5_Bin5]|nr:MAG: putative pterin-4-alpha-carbinolamine dehydratase [Alphaproteobacteria bacterium MarineAlpha5_Bin5]|tara:strand:+ start:11766 stop:12104 length:339 start_codon:yes stop_codon:yes gene_type:complete
MNADFTKLKCKPCSGKTKQMSSAEITQHLSSLIEWNTNDEKKMIFKKYSFKSFKKALDFTNMIGKLADEEGHHPDISLGWGYCIVMIHTHAIKGLSKNDFILASKIDSLISE